MHRNQLHTSLIEAYTDQAANLPESVRTRINAAWTDEAVELFAYTDLDADFNLTETWVALGASQIAVVEGEQVHVYARSEITHVQELSAMSCHVMHFHAEKDQAPRFTLRYTQRQHHTMDNIKTAIEQDIHPAEAAETLYADSIAGSIREAQATVSGNDMAIVWRLLRYVLPYKKELIIGSVTAVIMTLCSLVPPYITKFLIDHISGEKQLSRPDQIWIMLGFIAGAYVVRTVAMWMRLRYMAFLGEYVAHDLRRDLYNKLQSLGMRFFSRKQTGSIISRVSSDTDRLWDFVAFGIVEVSVSVIMLVGLGAVLLSLDVRLGLVMTLPIPLFLLAFYLHGKNINRIFLKAWRLWSSLTSQVSGTIPGMRVVKAFNQEKREIERFGTKNDDFMASINEVHASWTLFWPRLVFGFHALSLAIWFFALPRLTELRDPALTPGTFIAFLLYMNMFFHPLEVIGQMTRMLNRAISSAYRVFEVLDTEPQIQNIDEPITLDPVEGHIQFEEVSFSYDGVNRVLKSLSFEVQPGQMIGLVGPSGSGKSTIINLMARFYDATQGTIRIDGKPIKDLEVGPYRRQLGMVLQEPYLFHGTILENIRYGMEDCALEDVIRAATAANAHEFICKMPQGYETFVGERGQTLSGGERQRVSIARAILHNPRILILDEATSNVDTETERRIQEALDRLVAGRTVIAIAHRLSTLKKADRLLVIKDGELVEEGTHETLLQIEDGVFRNLYELQQELHERFAI
ncbi:MAG: ATP-binding cassette subfamily B protein [Candidatus Omnitrophota bacterium]|jgi:ATP-binding cassette subfamily B protein